MTDCEPTAFDRRQALRWAGVLAVGAFAAGCAGSEAQPPPAQPPTVGADANIGGEIDALRTAVSLENLGVYAYTHALRRLRSGQFGVPPRMVLAFAERVRAHHAAHATALNRLLGAHGRAPYRQPDPALLQTVQSGLPTLRNIPQLASFSLTLEDAAAQTHLRNLAQSHDTGVIRLAARIAPVEQQHVALLRVTAGEYPAPDAFTPISEARPSTDVK